MSWVWENVLDPIVDVIAAPINVIADVIEGKNFFESLGTRFVEVVTLPFALADNITGGLLEKGLEYVPFVGDTLSDLVDKSGDLSKSGNFLDARDALFSAGKTAAVVGGAIATGGLLGPTIGSAVGSVGSAVGLGSGISAGVSYSLIGGAAAGAIGANTASRVVETGDIGQILSLIPGVGDLSVPQELKDAGKAIAPYIPSAPSNAPAPSVPGGPSFATPQGPQGFFGGPGGGMETWVPIAFAGALAFLILKKGRI